MDKELDRLEHEIERVVVDYSTLRQAHQVLLSEKTDWEKQRSEILQSIDQANERIETLIRVAEVVIAKS